jgi:hypothetical protein
MFHHHHGAAHYCLNRWAFLDPDAFPHGRLRVGGSVPDPPDVADYAARRFFRMHRLEVKIGFIIKSSLSDAS